MFTQYFDILSDKDFEYLMNILKEPKWSYGRKSNKYDTVKFWQMDLDSDNFLKNTFVPIIEKLTNTKLNVHQIVANGQTFGQEGSWHYDDNNDDSRTFVFYTNKCDDISIVGETYFKDDDGNISCANPIPNSGVFFKSSMMHKGCSPKIEFNDMRITIAFKLSTTGELKNKKTLL